MASHTPGAPVFAPPAELPDWALRSVDLANPRLGAKALAASDDFFAEVARMLNPEPAQFVPGKFDTNGKWMDGWESRRKRVAGHDWCIIRLGCAGTIAGFDLDTSFFTGNFPPAASLDGCPLGADPDCAASWQALLPACPLLGDRHHLLALPDGARATVWTHLRLNILPDGGVARLRVYGRPAGRAEADGDGLSDLAAALSGGYAVAWNDSHYGHPDNLLRPGRGVDMGDGWETRRRREPGFDWCILALGAPGRIGRVEVDTAHFKGNFPDRCSLHGAFCPDLGDGALIAQSQFWPTLLPETPLAADRQHRFDLPPGGAPITHVRFNLYPDGGVSRLRLWGTAVES